ncbi:unnamed protein product [Diatraea saccharalis]|uniref:Uncharacterized protein n=1 Tax=Diatraea saccharalis TaxID=40085 RepID=A0A9N9QW43_9NEOP|nr:unnamed protein product [Diatraea saccharalis]
MNSKISKRRKHATARKTHNNNEDEAEVFVLPPNLLEKLGIQLGNIQPTQEYPTRFNKSDINSAKTKHKNKADDNDTENLHLNYNSIIQKDNSILKTASLMKESVFLSPTFVPTLSDVIAGEVEIANTSGQPTSNGELNIEHNKNLGDLVRIQENIDDDNENGTLDFPQRQLQTNQKKMVTLQKQEEIFKQDLSCLEAAITESVNLVITAEKLNEYPVSPIVFSNEFTDVEKTNDIEKVKHPLSKISEDNLASKNFECDKHEGADIEDNEKITLEDLKLKDSIHYDTLLTNEIECLDSLDNFLISQNLESGASSSEAITGSTFLTNQEESKNKVKILSQQIVDYKTILDCDTSHLNKNKLIPVTIDTIISTRKDTNLSLLQSNEITSPPNSYTLEQQQKASNCSKEISPINNNGCLTEGFAGKDIAFIQVLHKKSLSSLNVPGEKSDCSDTTDFETIEKVCSSAVSVNGDIDYKSLNYHNEPKEHSETCVLNNCNEVTDTINDKNKTVLSINNNTISEFNMPVANSVVNAYNINNVEIHENDDFEQHMDVDTEIDEHHIKNASKDKNSDETHIDLNSHITTIIQEKEIIENICIPSVLVKEKGNHAINGRTQLKNCVQGVEKPGGSGLVTFSINTMGLKTYHREKKVSKILQHNVGNEIVSTNESNITLKEVRVLGFDDSIQDYCLCNDFGQLNIYDHDDAYEHIHFWETKSVCNDPEMIFDIYYENTDVFAHQRSTQYDLLNIKEVDDKEITPICWKVISKEIVGKNVHCKDTTDNQVKETLLDSEPLDFCSFCNDFSKNKKERHSSSCSRNNVIINDIITKKDKSFTDSVEIVSDLVTPSNSNKNEVAANLVVPDVLNDEDLEESITVIQLINDEDFNEMTLDDNIDRIETKLLQSSSIISQVNNVVTEVIFDENNDINIPVITKIEENKNITQHISTYPEAHCKNDKQASNSSVVVQVNQITQINSNFNNQNYASPNEKNEVTAKEDALDTLNNEDLDDSLTVIQLINDEELNEMLLDEIVGQTKTTLLPSSSPISEDKHTVPEANTSINIHVNIKTEQNKNITQHYSKCPELHHKNDKQANNSSVFEQVYQTSQTMPNHITQSHASLNENNNVRRPVLNCNRNKSCTEVNDETHTEIVPKLTVEAEESSISEKRKLAYVAALGEPEAKRKRLKSCQTKFSSKMDEPPSNKKVECGVCYQSIADAHWKDHAAQCHNCVAWIKGQNIDFDNEDFVEELNQRLNEKKILECHFCCFKINHLATFILHIKNCQKLKSILLLSKRVSARNLSPDQINEKGGVTKKNKSIKCGRCKQIVDFMLWPEHVRGHNYLTWKEGEPVLNLEDEAKVRQHLLIMSDRLRGLSCKKCGLVRKQPKSFLHHVNNCNTNILDSNDTDCANTSSTSADVTLDASVVDSIKSDSIDQTEIQEPTREFPNESIYPAESTSTKCGVCKEVVDLERWIDHARGHDYLTWKEGEPVIELDDEDQVRRHLTLISKEIGGLTCNKCGIVRKQAKRFLDHVGECGDDEQMSLLDTDCANSSLTSADVTLDSSKVDSVDLKTRSSRTKKTTAEQFLTKVTCGVCKKQVDGDRWSFHIRVEHNYLAWKIEETPLDLEDEDMVRDHLKAISNREDGLVCNKCDVKKKYPKVFLDHVRFCIGDILKANDRRNISLNGDATLDSSEVASDGSRRESADYIRPSRRRKRARISSLSDDSEEVVSKKTRLDVPECEVVKCGVCKLDIQESTWTTHIGGTHNYLAWKDGDQPLNLEDDEAVLNHLVNLTQSVKKLTCFKCKYSGKKAREFLEHIKQCNLENVVVKNATTSDTKNVTCGVCKNELKINQWNKHIREQHNYLAWMEGDAPLDLEDFDAVRDYLKAISKREGGLSCIKCNVKKKYPKLFLDHVRYCSGVVSVSKYLDFNFITSHLGN